MKAGRPSGRWIGLLLFGALVAVPNGPAAAATTNVALRNTKFVPPNVNVAAGDTVVWKNEDNVAHTVTFDDGFDSHPRCTVLLGPVNCMDPGQTAQRSFDQPGEYRYRCKIHGSMVGMVAVKAAEVTTTTDTTPTTEPPTTVTTLATTTTTRKLATSSTMPSTTTSTAPAETTTTLTPNESPSFEPEGGDDDQTGTAAPAASGGGDSGSGTVALIVAMLLAVAGGGGVLLWRLRPRSGQP